VKRMTLVALLLWAGVVGADPAPTDATYDVYLDDKPIGYHRFDFQAQGDKTVLSSEAEFNVKVLFINAFSYEHENREVWRDGCLTEIDAYTDSNGKEFEVEGSLEGDAFDLKKAKEPTTLPGCVKTFAYWNTDILNETRLLNSQTGEYEDVTVAADGRETLSIDGKELQTERYRLTTRKGDIKLWYTADEQRWVALDAPAKGDRRLRYTIRNPKRVLASPTVVAGSQ